ncbi:MAG: OmpA family protein [Kiritimatiellia bacterium]|jgi:peptidoglycan-associated lipoprotein
MRIDKSLLTTVLVTVLAATFFTGCRTASKTRGDGYTEGDIISGQEIYQDGLYNVGDQPLDSTINFQTLERATDVGQHPPVYFQYDSSSIAPEESAKIAAVAELLRATPAIVLVVEGNCDERGTNEYNISLGERRALAVREQLIALGIDGARIQTVSYGEENPADPGHNEAAWMKNRRAEFAFYRR